MEIILKTLDKVTEKQAVEIVGFLLFIAFPVLYFFV